MGEVLSDGFMDPAFWQALGAHNKQLLAQVQMFVARVLERVFKTVGYNKRTEQYLSDYQRVMQIAGEIMAEYQSLAEALSAHLPSLQNSRSVSFASSSLSPR